MNKYRNKKIKGENHLTKKEFMNINLQTILAIIPYIQLYSAYRIKKFRQFFLLWITIGVGTAILFYFTGEKISGMSHVIGMPFYVIFDSKMVKRME